MDKQHICPLIGCLGPSVEERARARPPRPVGELSDVFLPHQIFIAITDIWNGGNGAAACFHSRKGRGWVKKGESYGFSSAVGLDVKSIPALCRLGSARRLLSALQRPLGCCNLPSAPPDYRLLRAVWRRAAGRARWQEEG